MRIRNWTCISLDHSVLGNGSFLHGSIVSKVQMKSCLLLPHYLVSTQFSSLSLELIFSLGQLEPKSLMTFQSLCKLHFSSKLFLEKYIQTVPNCNSFNIWFNPGPTLYVLSFNFSPHIWHI